ncbi:glycolate oxidase FAD binding subunit [Pseudonocardia hierapolitana]|uniref:Glycolate oxidase FAD binding subunit n=1 Tax=Pseudonocardia hierapolitana TaxID=1128676 RepID=A0A561SWX3_9PSEU|nr:FAD-binding protein [Pseudonocardia hierapolitana]TWF79357.1 glycolate oxidase FAD binding subunit [Pseudonocardia hierapolitana]
MSTTTTIRPTDLRSLRDAVLDTAGTIGIAGAGTAADWAGPLAPVDAVLDTTGLTGVITHNPGDMTVSVRSGTPLRQLQDELAPHGQHVSFDAARIADGATVGGLVATADAGPAALVFGSLRDLVIGVTIVLADGTVARSGGHVIKNVAGYDLTKLLHGSHGTLGVLAEVVLRLHPVPERAATLAIHCSLEEAAEHAATVLGGPYEPAAMEWTSDGVLLIRLEGTADALDARVQRLRTALGTGELLDLQAHSDQGADRDRTEQGLPENLGTGPEPGDVPPAERAAPPSDERPVRRIGTDESAVRRDEPWERYASLVRGAPEFATLRIGVRPSLLPAVLADLPTESVTAGLGTGVATVALPPAAVAAAHARVHAAGGTSVLRSRPAGAEVPAWGPPPSAIAVLRAVKAELDPQGRFGPGRFDPWM